MHTTMYTIIHHTDAGDAKRYVSLQTYAMVECSGTSESEFNSGLCITSLSTTYTALDPQSYFPFYSLIA